MDKLKRAIFLDRDGVISKWEPGTEGDDASWYILGWDQFEFLTGVTEAMFQLYLMNYELFVVSNQSGIAKGLEYKGKPVTEESIFSIFSQMDDEITARIRGLLRHRQAHDKHKNVAPPEYSLGANILDPTVPKVIRQFMFCSHLPKHNCACRKPKAGMIYSLAVKWGIDLGKSWMIGDQDSDIKAGYNAGVRPIKIEQGAEAYDPIKHGEAASIMGITGAFPVSVPNLLNAVQFIQNVDKWGQEHGI